MPKKSVTQSNEEIQLVEQPKKPRNRKVIDKEVKEIKEITEIKETKKSNKKVKELSTESKELVNDYKDSKEFTSLKNEWNIKKEQLLNLKVQSDNIQKDMDVIITKLLNLVEQAKTNDNITFDIEATIPVTNTIKSVNNKKKVVETKTTDTESGSGTESESNSDLDTIAQNKKNANRRGVVRLRDSEDSD